MYVNKAASEKNPKYCFSPLKTVAPAHPCARNIRASLHSTYKGFLDQNPMFFFASLAAQPNGAFSLEVGHHNRISMPLFDRNLIDPDRFQTFGWRVPCDQILHVGHFHAPDLIPAQPMHLGHTGNRHFPALTSDGCLKALGETSGGGQPC